MATTAITIMAETTKSHISRSSQATLTIRIVPAQFRTQLATQPVTTLRLALDIPQASFPLLRAL